MRVERKNNDNGLNGSQSKAHKKLAINSKHIMDMFLLSNQHDNKRTNFTLINKTKLFRD